jgi:hypothetical protein
VKFNLITSYYRDRVAERQQEIDNCLLMNLKSKEVDCVIIVVSPSDVKFLDKLSKSKKIKKAVTIKRPTYNDFFLLTHPYPDDVNCIVNSDIIMNNPSVKLLKEYAWDSKHCFALSRWDLKANEKGEVLFADAVFYDHVDSQDCWIFKGSVPIIEGADFTQGICGCDNVISYLLDKNGYMVFNPSKNIVTFHYHLTQVRNYIADIDKTRLPPPYKLLPTIYIEEVPQIKSSQ